MPINRSVKLVRIFTVDAAHNMQGITFRDYPGVSGSVTGGSKPAAREISPAQQGSEVRFAGGAG